MLTNADKYKCYDLEDAVVMALDLHNSRLDKVSQLVLDTMLALHNTLVNGLFDESTDPDVPSVLLIRGNDERGYRIVKRAWPIPVLHVANEDILGVILADYSTPTYSPQYSLSNLGLPLIQVEEL